MASAPADPHPDSEPQLPDEHPDSPAPESDPGRESVEGKSPLQDPGTPGGTAGTGGDNKVQDSEFER